MRFFQVSCSALVIEEVRYDFAGFPKYADDFLRDLLRLMIISKLNSPLKNKVSKNSFLSMISMIEGSEAHVVKYAQPVLYVKYRGVEFTDQRITSQFVRLNEHVIDVTMESIFAEFVKSFDSMASTAESRVRWGVLKTNREKEQDQTSEEIVYSRVDAEMLFASLNSFIESVIRLTYLDPKTNPDGLMGTKVAIKNAMVTRKSMHIEILVGEGLNILRLNPGRGKIASSILFGSSEPAKAIISLMNQS
jgi:hypothetical protein